MGREGHGITGQIVFRCGGDTVAVVVGVTANHGFGGIDLKFGVMARQIRKRPEPGVSAGFGRLGNFHAVGFT
jgi:hypothetical protein